MCSRELLATDLPSVTPVSVDGVTALMAANSVETARLLTASGASSVMLDAKNNSGNVNLP